MAVGIPPAESDISVNPDMLPTATSLTTEVSEEWMMIDTPDPVESGMEATSGSPPAVSDISVDTDVLQTAISVMTQVSDKWMVIDSPDAVESGMEMAGGCPPAEVDISVGPGRATDSNIRDDGSIRKVVGEVCHGTRRVMFGWLSQRKFGCRQ